MERDPLKTPKKMLASLNEQKFLTPNGKHNTLAGKSTPNAVQRQTSRFSMLKSVICTPPSRFSKIKNPFEAGLAERLHLPFICSPSLFQRPNTPQFSSTHFEWNIDEVSSLQPATFEAHETQFIASPNPEIEAKAQAAISSFFREQIVVPSPIDCPLRNQKIILPDVPVRATRDGICQTELSLPPILPKDIEDLLRPYFTQTMNQQQTPVKVNAKKCDTSIDYEARDASLRRKLFDEIEVSDASSSEIGDCKLENVSPHRNSLDMECVSMNNELDSSDLDRRKLNSSQNDTFFGSLSPITKTPTHNQSQKKNRSYLSTPCSALYRSTPERSSFLCRTCSSESVRMLNHTSAANNHSTDMQTNDQDITMNSFVDDETSSSYLQTPSRRKCRYGSRKILSRSFTCLSEQTNNKSPNNDVNLVIVDTDSGFNELDDLKNKIESDHVLRSKSAPQCLIENMDTIYQWNDEAMSP